MGGSLRRADAEIEKMSIYLRYSLTFPLDGRFVVLLMRSMAALNPFRRADAEIEKMSTYLRYYLIFSSDSEMGGPLDEIRDSFKPFQEN